MNIKLLISSILIGGIAVSGFFTASAEEENAQGRSYNWKRIAPTLRVEPYITTVYTSDLGNVLTMRGDAVYHGKDSVISFKVNPAGTNLALLTRDKKSQGKVSFFRTSTFNDELKKFDSKRFGNPTATAYMPDARTAIVATENGIYFLDGKKFEAVGSIRNLPFRVERMVVSPNGYFLAVTDNGDNLVIYNIEEKRIRKEMKIGEKINDLSFSPDNSDLAVLTDDGILTLYNTRTFDMRKMIDDLGLGRACAYNLDGKYMAVVTDDFKISVINLLKESERNDYMNRVGGTYDVEFIRDNSDNTILVIPTSQNLLAIRLPYLKPFYNKLIADEVDRKMDEWLKMMPGETMEEYRARVTDESRARQRMLFEDEIATGFAGDLLSGATMSLGSYDRANGVLALNFDSMPTIYLPVPESEVTSIHSAGDLTLSEVMYGIMPDDSFEIVFAKVTNSADGKTYVYDNLMRKDMQYMAADDAITLEMLQQQQMEELKLQELREKVMEEAKKMNVISDHTQISVDSKVVPEYNADGEKILNYQVNVTYQVDPEYSATEDFGPGKYHVEESGAASSMLNIVKQAFEGEFSQYLGDGKKMRVRLLGTADATPIVRGIPYDGSYGEFEEEPVYVDGRLKGLSVDMKNGIKENEQLAFLRALGVKDYLNRNVNGFKEMDSDYRYEVNVSKDKGSEYRRITLELTFINAY